MQQLFMNIDLFTVHELRSMYHMAYGPPCRTRNTLADDRIDTERTIFNYTLETLTLSFLPP